MVEKPKKQPNGRRDHPVGEVGEDILAIAAYYERKERLRPRRQSAEKGQGNEQADVEKVVEKPKKRARTGKPGTTLSIWSQKALGDDDGNSEGEVVVEPTAEDYHLSIHGAGSVPKRVTNKSEGLQIGQRIEVLFDDPPDYFPGTITGKDKGRWQIEYDDGDREELDLSTTKYRLLRGEGLIAGPKAHKAAKPTKRMGTRPTRRGLTLLDLMKKGLMEPGQGVLRVEYKGHVFLGDLTPSGSICYEGELWESPSSWSIHVKRRVFPDKKADDGWKSVFYVTEDGEKTKLEQLRRTHALKMFGFGSFEKETANAPKAKPELAAPKAKPELAARAPAAEPAAPAEPTEYAKQRPKRELKKRHWLEHDLEGHEMVPMELFCGSPGSGEEGSQPFGVQVSCGCQVVMDVHGFMSFSKEIIGLLGGRVERTQGGRPVVRVEEAFPVREIRTEDDTINVEMDPESEVEVRAKMADAGLIAVGWYHSHPSFPAVPSVIDLTNQLRYQRLVREEDGLEPWIAAIVSPYNKTRPAMESELTYFYVDAGARTGGKDAELDRDCRSMALDTATSENTAFAAAAMSKIKMIKEWYGAEWEGASLWEGQTTLKDKLLHSVSSRLPSCWSDAMREAFLNSLNHLLV